MLNIIQHNGQRLTNMTLYNKIMIDIEMLAAIMKELGYLEDGDDESSVVKPNPAEPKDMTSDKSKVEDYLNELHRRNNSKI